MSKTVPFTEEDVKKYLDGAITHWRLCDAPKRRWIFRQRVEVPTHIKLP